jgi:hypothetical protein
VLKHWKCDGEYATSIQEINEDRQQKAG